MRDLPPDQALQPGLDAAADALRAFAGGPAQGAADAVGDAFARAGRRIGDVLGDAARSGQLSLSSLAAAILRDVSASMVSAHVTAPLEALARGALKGLPGFGARASGGPVTGGGAYLVGERGPELFVPGTAGRIEPDPGAGTGPVTIHIHMPQGASLDEARRSSSQVAAALARAVQRGGRLA